MNTDLFSNETKPKRDGFAHDIDRENGKEEWLTPPEIVRAVGPFDLDPCSPINRPWATAAKHYTIEDNGLMKPWEGYVWCNPPYGPKTGEWLARCAEHNNCMALVFARTETAAFQQHVWPKARALYFLKGRVSFYHVDGRKGGTAGAPSVLIAYGQHAQNILRGLAVLEGHYIANVPNVAGGWEAAS
jgi:hypothetical protein